MAEVNLLLHIFLVETDVVRSFPQVGGAHHACVAIQDIKPG
jgi:hypothetical protein